MASAVSEMSAADAVSPSQYSKVKRLTGAYHASVPRMKRRFSLT